MGVPDLRGGLGTSTFYTPAEGVAAARERERRPVAADGDGTIATHLIGPRNPKDARRPPARRHDPARPRRRGGRRSARRDRRRSWRSARGAGATGSGSSSRPGCSSRSAGWSGSTWSGSSRTFELYASPVNFDPERPSFPISAPPDYAGELAERARAVLHHGDGRGPRRPEQRADRRGGVPRPVRRRLATSARR